MMDQIIQSRQTYLGAFTLLGFALFLVAIAVLTGEFNYAVGACLPLCVGLAVLYAQRPMSFELTADAIVVHDPSQTIPYSTLETLIAPKRPANQKKPHPRQFPITVVHQGGTLHIPAKLSEPSDKIFDFLLETFPNECLSEVNPLLEDYLQEQLNTFGAERVWAYTARSTLGKNRRGLGFAVWTMVLVTAVLWLIAGLAGNENEWVGLGGLLLLISLVGLVVSLAFASNPLARVKNWRDSSLVISPLGMALVQGDLKGEMRWDELQDLKYNPRQFFAMSGHYIGWGILLVFAGAQVMIADVYNRPLYLIYQQIRSYWRRG